MSTYTEPEVSLNGGCVIGGSADPGPWPVAVDTVHDSIYRTAVVCVPATNQQLQYISRAVYVGTTGNLNVTMADGNNCLFTAVPAGTLLPIRIRRVLAASTTASTIVALS